MQYLKTQFETTQYYASLVLVPLVLFCIPLGQTAKSSRCREMI